MDYKDDGNEKASRALLLRLFLLILIELLHFLVDVVDKL